MKQYLANTRHSPNDVSMLDQRRRRWANIEKALSECIVLAGYVLCACAKGDSMS